MKRVIVFGGNGQLAQCLKAVEKNKSLDITYYNSKEANILEETHLRNLIVESKPEILINCAAYTAVDVAEDEPLKAAAVNAQGPELIAQVCAELDILLIHISTDFVFDGQHPVPLLESDVPNPINVYGKTKLQGEEAIIKHHDKHIIIRTSWLYSEFGNNFVKTMIRLGKEREELNVIFDQIGTPTYAVDLAYVILEIASMSKPVYGVYHYSNEGAASWYDFAHAIFKEKDLSVKLRPICSHEYPTKATRPAFSVLNKSKIKKAFNITIPHWRDSLTQCIKRI